jgi:hypothetical protein
MLIPRTAAVAFARRKRASGKSMVVRIPVSCHLQNSIKA